jgi:hypothetical protein
MSSLRFADTTKNDHGDLVRQVYLHNTAFEAHLSFPREQWFLIVHGQRIDLREIIPQLSNDMKANITPVLCRRRQGRYRCMMVPLSGRSHRIIVEAQVPKH